MFFWPLLGARREPNFQEISVYGMCALFAFSVMEKTGGGGCEVCANISGERRLSEVRKEVKTTKVALPSS